MTLYTSEAAGWLLMSVHHIAIDSGSTNADNVTSSIRCAACSPGQSAFRFSSTCWSPHSVISFSRFYLLLSSRTFVGIYKAVLFSCSPRVLEYWVLSLSSSQVIFKRMTSTLFHRNKGNCSPGNYCRFYRLLPGQYGIHEWVYHICWRGTLSRWFRHKRAHPTASCPRSWPVQSFEAENLSTYKRHVDCGLRGSCCTTMGVCYYHERSWDCWAIL